MESALADAVLDELHVRGVMNVGTPHGEAHPGCSFLGRQRKVQAGHVPHQLPCLVALDDGQLPGARAGDPFVSDLQQVLGLNLSGLEHFLPRCSKEEAELYLPVGLQKVDKPWHGLNGLPEQRWSALLDDRREEGQELGNQTLLVVEGPDNSRQVVAPRLQRRCDLGLVMAAHLKQSSEALAALAQQILRYQVVAGTVSELAVPQQRPQRHGLVHLGSLALYSRRGPEVTCS
mmetsp:Transcript_109054/g.260201  ORF Transcript_109054/g.260201 Transcript_109054/m.260201 type:complete len:232 (-) Transcript_109054:69-764(-)